MKTDTYFVFLTEVGDGGGLFLASRTPTGFTVQSRASGSTAGFQYRIVARRKDLTNTRMERVTPPPTPELRPLPQVSDVGRLSSLPAESPQQ